jgi:hypothetical protein
MSTPAESQAWGWEELGILFARHGLDAETFGEADAARLGLEVGRPGDYGDGVLGRRYHVRVSDGIGTPMGEGWAEKPEVGDRAAHDRATRLAFLRAVASFLEPSV